MDEQTLGTGHGDEPLVRTSAALFGWNGELNQYGMHSPRLSAFYIHLSIRIPAVKYRQILQKIYAICNIDLSISRPKLDTNMQYWYVHIPQPMSYKHAESTESSAHICGIRYALPCPATCVPSIQTTLQSCVMVCVQ